VTLTPLHAAAERNGLDVHELALALSAPPLPPLPPPPPRVGRVRLSPDLVVMLRQRFATRPPGRAADWFEAEARRLGVGHATVRRAVYGFDSYPAEGGTK
jgi:hypothetical protein